MNIFFQNHSRHVIRVNQFTLGNASSIIFMFPLLRYGYSSSISHDNISVALKISMYVEVSINVPFYDIQVICGQY